MVAKGELRASKRKEYMAIAELNSTSVQCNGSKAEVAELQRKLGRVVSLADLARLSSHHVVFRLHRTSFVSTR